MTNHFRLILHGRCKLSFFLYTTISFVSVVKILPYLDGVRVTLDTTCTPIRLFPIATMSVP